MELYFIGMPRKYQQNLNAPLRGSWTEQQLRTAVEKVQAGEISKREAHRRYNVPPRTLERRINTGRFEKGGLGRQGDLVCLYHFELCNNL